MLSLTEKQKLTFANEYSEKFFILFFNISSIQKNYSHDTISIYDNSKNSWFNFIGALTNELKFDLSFQLENNSYNMPSISISIIEDRIDLISLAKILAINFSEFELYFITNELSIDEALPLMKGIIGIDQIDIINEPYSMSLVSIDDKYDKVFPPLILSTTLSWVNLTNDAEKYIGESVPIVYGFIENPGLPIPLFFDDLTTRKWAICNHQITDLSGLQILADGVVVSNSFYTLNYDSVNNVHQLIVATDLNYQTYFKGKKITCVCKGLLYNSANPSIGNVVLHMLQNYSNLDASLIDTQGINTHSVYLSIYKVARFFNSSSTVFETIKELSSEFPFIFSNSGFAKTIICVDSNYIPYTFELLKYKHWLERIKGIRISKHTSMYSKLNAKYKYDALNNRWKGYDFIDETNNTNCANLQSRIGGLVKDKSPYDLYSVSEFNTARSILNYKSIIHSIPKFIMTYKCKHNCIVLELGDGVLLTDEELNIYRKKFMVIDKNISREFIYFTIVNVENL